MNLPGVQGWACAVLLACCILGCATKPVKPLAGTWTGKDSQTKTALILGVDGTFILIAANDFTFAGLEGIYRQSAETFTLDSHVLGAGTSPQTIINYHYKWITSDSIEMFTELDPSQKAVLTREPGAAPKTASVENLSGKLAAKPDKVDSATCMSNLKQLATASLMYEQDWDSMLPACDLWDQRLMPYVKNEQQFTCPTVKAKGDVGGYAMNSDYSSARVGPIAQPESVALLFETATLGAGVYAPENSMLSVPRHDGKINVAYLDGHVKAH